MVRRKGAPLTLSRQTRDVMNGDIGYAGPPDRSHNDEVLEELQ